MARSSEVTKVKADSRRDLMRFGPQFVELSKKIGLKM